MRTTPYLPTPVTASTHKTPPTSSAGDTSIPDAPSLQDQTEHTSPSDTGLPHAVMAQQLRERWADNKKAWNEAEQGTPGAGPSEQSDRAGEASQVTKIACVPHSCRNLAGDRHNVDFKSLIQHFDTLETSPGKPGEAGANHSSIAYSRPKSEIGGTDMGMIGRIGNAEYLVKTGIGYSLLNQTMKHHASGDLKSAQRKIGYIVSNFCRLLGRSKEEQKSWETKLNLAFNDFLKNDEGQKLLEMAKDGDLDLSAVNALHIGLVGQIPELRDVLGIVIATEIINGVCSQALANSFHRSTGLTPDHIPDSSFLLVGKTMYTGSRLIQESTPFDTYLLSTFLPEGISVRDMRAATALVKQAERERVDQEKLKAAENLIAEVSSESNIARGKENLAVQLSAYGMDGIFSALLMRLTLGEKDDLGPDNMVVVKGDDNRNKLVNIDLTGFRYDREQDLQDSPEKPVLHGWKKIVENPSGSADLLLDKGVFHNRYAVGLPAVQDAIADVIKQVLANNAEPDVKQLKEWYASLDEEKTANSMRETVTTLCENLDPQIAPNHELINQSIERNCKFIYAAVSQCRTELK